MQRATIENLDFCLASKVSQKMGNPCVPPLSSKLHADITASSICTSLRRLVQASDNTRHLSRHPKTGERYVVPPEQMKRVVICSGAMYYHLGNARRQRKIRDIALVRLEQLAPFPHDLLVQVKALAHPGQPYIGIIYRHVTIKDLVAI